MATAQLSRQPVALPVGITPHAPADGVAEWRLAYMLVNGGDWSQEALDAICDNDLKPSEFTEPELRDVIERALALHAEGHPVDEVTLTTGVQDLALRDALDAVILRIRNMSYAAGDAYDLVARIRKASALRQLQSRAHNLNIYLRHEGVTVEDGLAEVSRLVDDVARLVSSTQVDADGAPIINDGIWRPTVQYLDDLMRLELPPTRWVVDGVFAEGLTLFGAKAKRGKTTFMFHVGLSIAQGAPALGSLATECCEVLYLALEDNPRRIQRRVRRMLQGEAAPHSFAIEYRWPALDDGGIEALRAWKDEHPALGLVVIDTLEHIRPQRRNGGGYADDYASVRDLQRLASELRIAVVVLHHLTKQGRSDPFDEINATMGLMASVDNMLVMRDGLDGVIELHRRGREYDDTTPLALQGDEQSLSWRLLGALADVTRSEARSKIVALLRQHPTGLGPTEIATTLDKTKSTVQTLLGKMLDERAPVITSSGGRYFAAD
ncbi:MAG TPA: AAA family ATPase [Ktedonobacterales bacterium]|nr:AAA family ATPase [Ktedonobacterales bacterium]